MVNFLSEAFSNVGNAGINLFKNRLNRENRANTTMIIIGVAFAAFSLYCLYETVKDDVFVTKHKLFIKDWEKQFVGDHEGLKRAQKFLLKGICTKGKSLLAKIVSEKVILCYTTGKTIIL